MKLIDRLKGEHIGKLAFENTRSPHIVEAITNVLEELEYVSDIKYGDWQKMKCLMPYLDSPYDLFYE